MKRSVGVLGAVARAAGGLALLAAGIISGCGNSRVTTPNDQVTADEALTVSRAAVLSIETGYSNTPVIFAIRQSPGAVPESSGGVHYTSEAASSDSLFHLTCPVVTLSPIDSRMVLSLDYGTPPGCISQLDKQPHSGRMTITQDRHWADPGYIFSFSDYTTGDFLVDGNVVVHPFSNGAALMVDLFLRAENGTTTVDADLAGVHDNHGTPLDLTDDSWRVMALDKIPVAAGTAIPTRQAADLPGTLLNAATITAPDGKKYIVAIDSANPVVLKAGCPWPVSGFMTLRVRQANSTNVSDPTRLDFGTGDCDDAAVVTLPGGETEAIHLSEVSAYPAQ